MDPHDVQTMVEVPAEGPLPDHLRQVLVRTGQKSRIDLHRHGLAHGHHFVLLQHAEELGLQAQGELADFIEKDRSPVGRAKHAQHGLLGARECAANVAEELAFEKTLADARAIDRDKRPVGTLALGKKPPGNQLLPRAAFAFNQNAAVRSRHLVNKRNTSRIALETPTIMGTPVAVTLSVFMRCLVGTRTGNRSGGLECVMHTTHFTNTFQERTLTLPPSLISKNLPDHSHLGDLSP